MYINTHLIIQTADDYELRAVYKYILNLMYFLSLIHYNIMYNIICIGIPQHIIDNIHVNARNVI